MDKKKVEIIVKDGWFAGVQDGMEVQELKPNYLEVNGWIGWVNENASIECMLTHGKYSMRYYINKYGFAKLTLRKKGKPFKELRRGYVLPGLLKNGTLGLVVSDDIEECYAYFHDEKYQKPQDGDSNKEIEQEGEEKICQH